jgi:hypothetical protein
MEEVTYRKSVWDEQREQILSERISILEYQQKINRGAIITILCLLISLKIFIFWRMFL